jgi:hypothetical protein
LTSTGIYILGIATAGQEANIAFSKKEPTTKRTGIPSSNEQSRDWNLLPASTVAAATIEELRANLRVSPASC